MSVQLEHDHLPIASTPFASNSIIALQSDQIHQDIQSERENFIVVNPGEQDSECDPRFAIKINWSKLKSKLGILAMFGFLYWLIITFAAFLIQFNDKSNSWLFKYCVGSMLFAFFCQCGIMSMVVTGYDEKNKHFRRSEMPIITLVMFPYALLMCIDLFVHSGSMFLGKRYISDGFSIAFIICHLLSLFCISSLHFCWHKGHTTFRFMNFFFEWIDIFSQLIVTLLYWKYSAADNKFVITTTFWTFTLIQLLFWIPPLTLGSAQNLNTLVKHVVVLDIFTDIPLIITTLISGAYSVQLWIFIDLIFKTILMLRGVVVNGFIYMLLPYLSKGSL